MTDAAFGKYGLIAELGHGGMADVFLAVAHGYGGFSKLVVIKRVRANLADDPDFRQMLIDEARLAGRLNHPNVVQTNEVGQVGAQFFIAMEYLEGQPFSRILHRCSNEGFPFLMHMRVLADTLAGLHHAHELKDYDGTPLNVVHRDANPQNIFVTYDGHVKVVDFGIAKAANRSTETRGGLIKGKLMYMSPEQAMGVEIDRRADIFSVGVMLWEAATRQRMWGGLEQFVVLQRLINADIPSSPREINPEVDAALDQIVRKALAYHPEKRYATAADLQNDLEEYLDKQGHQTGRLELGALVSELFKDRRTQQRVIIERQLAALKSQPGQFNPLATGETAVGAKLVSLTDVASRDVRAVTVTPSGTTVDPATALESGVDGLARSRNRGRRFLIGVVAIGMIAGAGITLASSFHTPKGAPATDAKSTDATSAPQPPEAQTITLTLRANPVETQFRIDSGAALSNPLAGKFPRDNREHVIEMFAPNHAPKTLSITFSNDREISATLDKLPEPKAEKPPGKASPTRTASPHQRGQASATPTQDELDSSL